MNKKIVITIAIICTTMISMVGCNSDNSKKIDGNAKETEAVKTSDEKSDLDNLNNLDAISNAYNTHIQDIMAHKQIRNLDSSSIKLDIVLEYAQKSKGIADTETNTNDKVDIIEKLTTLNDLGSNTTDETMKQVAQYIINEYENNNLEKNAEINLYLTRYLDKKIKSNQNLKVLDEVVFDMYQICKDSIRGINDSIDNNKEQINKKLPQAKELLK